MIRIEGDNEMVSRIMIGAGGDARRAGSDAVARAAEQVAQWFAGERTTFDLPLAPLASPRGEALRAAMCAIPFGATMTYGELARVAASAPRAVGQACARNPLPLVVPCHRVLSAAGAGNYSAGDGLATKNWLLDHERRHRG